MSLLGALLAAHAASVSAQSGLAARYPGDAGIGGDPDVVLAEDFEAPLSTILSRFNGHGPGGVEASADRPAASSGARSVILHPAGIGGMLYRLMDGESAVIHMRYYIKYLGTDYHHSGGSLGGYSDRTAWPQGDAGLKGVRPSGEKLINISFETQGTGAGSRLDTYMNWVDMQGQMIGGGWWGRNMLSSLAIPVRPNQWQCVELMVKMNSAPNLHDGELAIWLDGALIAHFQPGSPIGLYDSFSGNWIMDPLGSPLPILKNGR